MNKIKDKGLAKKIILMATVDQKIRKDYVKDRSLVNKMVRVDHINTRKIKNFVSEHGWPTISLVGKKASHMAWLLVQHADHDLDFQLLCLKLLKQAEKKNDINKQNIAYLTDRVLVNQGKKQIYGTQSYYDDKGELSLYTIKNKRKVNDRRSNMGLGPI